MKKRNKSLILFSLILSLFISIFLVNNTLIISTTSNQNLFREFKKTSSSTLQNIAVFINFSDNTSSHLDDEQSIENAYKIFNSEELFEMNSVNGITKVPSLKKYYERESYGDLIINTEIFPKENDKVVSYTDIHPRGYYLKYNETNKIGYKDNTEAIEREKELINNATSYISSMVESSNITKEQLDVNNDGYIDVITFIVEVNDDLPSSIKWGDLLWSHKSDNNDLTSTILDKKVKSYILMSATDYKDIAGLFSLNRGSYGTIIHELGHILGYKDLYRYGDLSSKPVGFYDIMGDVVGSNPQSFLTYYISEYNSETNWHNPLPVINKTTNDITLYKPNYIDKDEKRAIKIEVNQNESEYFVVEYHEKLNTYEDYSADKSGIIVYRVNERNKDSGNKDGSNQGIYDHTYVFRPNETGLGEGKGDLSKATLNMLRPTIGNNNINNNAFDNTSIFFSDGTNSGIKIEVTNETNDSVTFNVIFPETEGSGTKEDPYLINDATTFIYLMSLNTKNKYYKLTENIDFKDIEDYPIINFEGNLDGNNKIISNITSNNSGIFNYIGTPQIHTRIENLYVENLNVHSSKGDFLGGLASVANNVTLNNVHIKSGSVINEGTSINSLASTGGFLGNVNNSTIIENCSSSVLVKASKNIGGFIGINMNAKIKDSFYNGIIEGNTKVGGFIALQSITDNKYNIPENVYFYSENNNLNAVGGYASTLHNLNVLNEESLSKNITCVTLPKEINMPNNYSLTLPLTFKQTTNITYNVVILNNNILKYENNKLKSLNEGNTLIYVDINIGTNIMRLTSKVIVGKESESVTEKEVLEYLGLTKKENYIIGFDLGKSINEIKNEITNHSKVTLKSLTDENGNEINSGIVKTGLKLSVDINGTEYSYTIVIKGDVNGDGLIYATDYVKVKNHIMGKTKLTGAYLVAADINNDSNIYATDYVQIKNHIMGKKLIVQQ